MLNLPYLHQLGPLYLAQAAFTIWMLVDMQKRSLDYYWFWIVLFFQPFGAWAYFFIYKLRDLPISTSWLGALFTRPASVDELRYRVEHMPTPASWLALAERLVQLGQLEEAQPHLEKVLAREPERTNALFLLAKCHRGLGQPAEAAPLLQRIVDRQPNWRDYKGWRMLIDVLEEAGDLKGAVESCRRLARITQSLENRCLLAELLLRLDEKVEARKVVEEGLAEFQYATGASRRRDRRWVGRGRELLKTIR